MTLPRVLRILALIVLVVGAWVAIVVFHDRTVVTGEMPGIELNPWRWVALAIALAGCIGLVLASVMVESGHPQEHAPHTRA
jgi:hypothetical protein